MAITRTAIRRPVTVAMFVVAVMLFGVVSLNRLALNLLPDISYPSLTIQTDYPDAAPEEIEALVTRPVEEAVGVVSGLTRLQSTSRPGQSEVVLEFTWDVNMDLASLDVREKLDLIELPEDVEKPVILRFDPSFDPIMRVQLASTGLTLSRLRTLAERDLKKRLEAVDGVAAVKVSGGREEQIRIEIDEKRLAELGIPITEITQILRQENLNQASGSLYDLDANYLVRMLNEFRTVDEIRNIILRDQDGRKIVLGDVATVWRGVKDRGLIARYNGAESVELAIFKEGDANTVTAARAVEARLKSLSTDRSFPKNVQTAVVFNQAEFISQSVDNVLDAAVLGGLLATIVLFLFLRDMRSTIIIALSIPISVLATFALMYQTGLTLNIMSLGGVALGVGMLVDNSIVVLEAVDRYRREGGRLADQVFRGTREVGMAVSASTLTTIAVFLPLVFVEGVAGQLFKDQALTITYSLLASLAVAMTFIPMALALEFRKDADDVLAPEASPQPDVDPAAPESVRFGRARQATAWTRQRGRGAMHFVLVTTVRQLAADGRRFANLLGRAALWPLRPGLNAFDRGFRRMQNSYPRLLSWSLDHPGSVALGVFGSAAIAFVLAGSLGGELIPPLTQGEFFFEIRMPEGTPIERTDQVLREVEESVRQDEAVKEVFALVGGRQKNQFAVQALEENFGRLSVVMKNRRDREAEETTIGRVRNALAAHPELDYAFSRPTLFSFKTPIEVEIYSFDLDAQREAAEKIAARLAQIEGLRDIQSSAELGSPEVQVRFDRARLARFGLQESDVAQRLRNKIRGDVASRYRDDDRQIDILVRVDERDRNALGDVGDLIINAPRANQNQNRQRQNANSPQQADPEEESPLAGLQTAATGATANGRTENQQEAGVNLRPIRLDQVATIGLGRGPAEIRRIRSQRAAVVSANLTGRDLNSVSADIREALAELRPQLPLNTTVGLGGQNEELRAAYQSLIFALTLAIFLVYLVMASQFESLLDPFLILFTVPLAVIGVIFALALTGAAVSVMALLGVIILAGIVVNNAIVLIDYANQLRGEGFNAREAVIQAGQVRLRPILMTTLTTLLGLAPMALGWGEGAELRAPMAVTVMGGLAFATLLTLVLIPVVYERAHRKRAAVPQSAPALQPEWRPEGAD